VHQVGLFTRLYRDVRSTKHKIHTEPIYTVIK